MVSLSGICLLKGETVPQKTEWKGGRLIYDGVIIKNQFNLPQKGIKYHDEDRLSYDVMDTTIEMSSIDCGANTKPTTADTPAIAAVVRS